MDFYFFYILYAVTIFVSFVCVILIIFFVKEKEILKLKEDFTNMMVHDLRAPLLAIKDASDLMVNDDNLNKKEKIDFLRIISTESKILLGYVNSLLDASKIESGKLTVQKTPSDIKKIITDALEVFTPEAKKKKIEIKTYFDQNLPLVNCDAQRITQAINNLLSNSLKFTQEEGIITVQAVNKNGNMIQISISDTGVGIAKEKQKELFSKFSQVQGKGSMSQKKSIQGSGLGLFITKGIIQAHRGTITLESEPNKGTTISFTLPVEQSLPSSSPTTA